MITNEEQIIINEILDLYNNKYNGLKSEFWELKDRERCSFLVKEQIKFVEVKNDNMDI